MDKFQFQRPDDERYYKELLALGKSPDCICHFEWRWGEGGNRIPTLVHVISCPVHYPRTATLFGKVNERRDQE